MSLETQLRELRREVRGLNVTAPESNYLTQPEAAAKFKVSEKTLYRMRKSGLLPFKSLGKIIRYLESDIDKLFTTSK